eukprot:GHVO01055450.1.p2 GENE.GHVO01055450.1~~GHVO01055450.1.p2  ORF type:complete len:115 (-),score=9.30 GHVO01055450.1:243-587(-)
MLLRTIKWDKSELADSVTRTNNMLSNLRRHCRRTRPIQRQLNDNGGPLVPLRDSEPRSNSSFRRGGPRGGKARGGEDISNIDLVLEINPLRKYESPAISADSMSTSPSPFGRFT